MSNHFPDLSVNVSNLQYVVSLSTGIGGNNATMQPSASLVPGVTPSVLSVIPMLNYSFETGVEEDGVTITFDFSWFDQDATEANLVTMVDAVAAYYAAETGRDLDSCKACFFIQRQWFFTTLVTTEVQETGLVITEQMAYP